METNNSPFSKNEDRISKLPETLIHRILSFLDMKYAVQTSVLSRKWSHFWTSLPTLNFNSNLFISPEPEEDEYGFVYEKKTKDGFIDFVDNVFILRNNSSDIQRLHLVSRRCNVDITSRLKTWIVAAVRGNVEEIYVDASVSPLFRFPDCLFTCKSLTKLELKMGYKIILPNSIHLPRLKSLNLDSLSFDDENLANKLFSNCPVLESLIVEGRIRRVNLDISSLELKHLKLVNSSYRIDSKLKLYAPNLKSFISSNLDYSLENLSSLVTADINMVVQENDDGKPEIYSELPTGLRELYAQRMMKCLRALHNVKDLTISTQLLEVVSGAPEFLDIQPPQLCNLQCLKLRTRLSSDSVPAITYLLKISPNIESLFLEITKITFNSATIGDYWESGLSLACMLYHLKFVEIRGVQVCVNELTFLKILLKNAMVLEKVVIFYSPYYQRCTSEINWMSFKEKENRKLMMFRQKLLTFPRASSSTAIFFLTS